VLEELMVFTDPPNKNKCFYKTGIGDNNKSKSIILDPYNETGISESIDIEKLKYP
jgi:hypothetical protein